MGPHFGSTVIEGVLHRRDETLTLPSKFPWQLAKTPTVNDLNLASLAPKTVSSMWYNGPSRHGKDMVQYQAWLKTLPLTSKNLRKS
jgi:hypothetical protein